MTLQTSARNIAAKLEDAIRAQSWGAADALRERLKVITLDSIVGQNGNKDLTTIEALLDQARSKLVLGQGASTNFDATSLSWLLAADVESARLARRVVPAREAAEHIESGRERILRVLSTSNQSWLSNTQIEQLTGLSRETVSRLLKILTVEQIINSRRAGRAKLHRLVAKRNAIQQFQTAFQIFEQKSVLHSKIARSQLEYQKEPSAQEATRLYALDIQDKFVDDKQPKPNLEFFIEPEDDADADADADADVKVDNSDLANRPKSDFASIKNPASQSGFDLIYR